MTIDDPLLALSSRLRSLREEHWAGAEITQGQVARAIGVSVPAISSWESRARPRIPPRNRIEAYAALFATQRSLSGSTLRRLEPADLTGEEELAMGDLLRELLHLRGMAIAATHPSAALPAVGPVALAQLDQAVESLSTGPWRFADGSPVTIVCAQLPQDMLDRIPYTDVNQPDYIELLTYSELDALFELHGHLSAANPGSRINLRTVDRLEAEDYTHHLVTLGGIDWNRLTIHALESIRIPVRQVADWAAEDGQYFEVGEDEDRSRHMPVLQADGTSKILREDVALFARAVNPFNRERTLTICNGMYGRGTYGAVRALTDPKFRDRNAEYLESRFGGSGAFCLLTRVGIVNGRTVTPDWTSDDHLLFEWSGPAGAVSATSPQVSSQPLTADPGPAEPAEETAAMSAWRMADGHSVRIVCAQWPPSMLVGIPYTAITDPDYIELLTYSELDALFELHGRLRATNPSSRVLRRTADHLDDEDYTSHLVTLGGIDWNTLTTHAIESMKIPVRQVADWAVAGGQYFEVDADNGPQQHRPVLEMRDGKEVLREDVALFARAVNPYNKRRMLTICSGMYGRGTYGAVRALTDPTFRDRNAEYLRWRFGNSSSYCILTRVPIAVNGKTLTPDWTVENFRLFEWAGEA